MSKLQKTGSEVDLITGAYSDEVTDLEIAVPGKRLTLDRYYDRNGWRWRFFDANLDIVSTGGGAPTLTHMGVVYPPADNAGTIFSTAAATITAVAGDPEVAWRWQNTQGDWRAFDEGGLLLSFGDRNQNSIEFDRDSANRISALHTGLGEPLASYERDAQGHVTAIEASDGRRVEYTWSGERLIAVEDAQGEVTSYTYDGAGRLTKKAYPGGKVRSIEYASNGVVASVLDEDGTGMYFTYGYNTVTETNYASTLFTDGALQEKWFDRYGNVTQESVNGQPIPQPEGTGKLLTDSKGRVAGSTLPNGQVATSYSYTSFDQIKQYTDARGIKHSYEYDAQGNLIRQIDGVGRADAQVTSWTRDSHGNALSATYEGDSQTGNLTMSFEYDDRGNLTKLTDAAGQSGLATYDDRGQLLTWTTPANDVVSFAYDASGRYTERRFSPGDGSPDVVDVFSYSLVTGSGGAVIGRTASAIDALGRSTTAELDSDGRVLAFTDGFGRKETWEYDSRGREVRYVDGDGRVAERTFEILPGGNLRETLSLEGDVVSVLVTDALERVVSETSDGITTAYFYDGASTRPSQIQRPGGVELLEYDMAGNLVERTYVLTATGEQLLESFSYQGKVLTGQVDPAGGVALMELSSFGEPTTRVRGSGATEEFEYDALGRLVSVSDGAGNLVLSLAYDSAGRVLTRTVAGAHTLTYEYDAMGRVTSVASSAGPKATMEYEAGGLPVRMERFADASDAEPEEVIQRNYDALGRETLGVSPEVTRTIAWDDLARKRTEIFDFGDVDATVTRTFDALERTSALSLPGGLEIHYEYAASGRVAKATILGAPQGGEDPVFEFSRQDGFTLLTDAPGGVSIATTRNPLGNVAEILVANTSESVLAQFEYEYDGYRLIAMSTDAGDTTYEWDVDGRLSGAVYPTLPTFGVEYDLAGNRSSSSSTGAAPWVYGAGNRLLSAGTSSYSWDGRGQLASWTVGGGTLSFEWTAGGQLAAVRNGQNVLLATYGYDDGGRRVRKTVGAATTYFVYVDEGLAAELDATGAPLRIYGWMPDTAFQSEPLFVKAGSELHSVVADPAGTPLALVSVAGQVTWRGEQEAFGRVHPAPASSINFALRGSSQYFDAETGLHYNGARYYDPGTGRYISAEPLLEESQLTNFYVFAHDNPLAFVDRTGLGPEAGASGNGAQKSKGSSPSGGISYGDGKWGGNVKWDAPTPGAPKRKGGASLSFKDPNNWKGGGGTSVGGGVGVGGSVKFGGDVERRDCCIPAESEGGEPTVVKGGQFCVSVYAGAEGFAGGAEIKTGIAQAGAKAVSAGATTTCRVCNKCGDSSPVKECCVTADFKAGDFSLGFLWLKAGVTVYKASRTVCTGDYDGVDDDGGKSGWFGLSGGIGSKSGDPSKR